jgi:peptide/nickel transport system permease protein
VDTLKAPQGRYDWKFPSDTKIGSISASPVLNTKRSLPLDDDVVYVCSQDGKIYSVGAGTKTPIEGGNAGTKIWEFDTGNPITYAPCVDPRMYDRIIEPLRYPSLNSLSMKKIGFIVGDSIILKYENGFWRSISSPVKKEFYDVSLYNESFAVAIGEDGTILRYNGITWRKEVNVSTECDLYSVDLLNDKFGIAVGEISRTLIWYDDFNDNSISDEWYVSESTIQINETNGKLLMNVISAPSDQPNIQHQKSLRYDSVKIRIDLAITEFTGSAFFGFSVSKDGKSVYPDEFLEIFEDKIYLNYRLSPDKNLESVMIYEGSIEARLQLELKHDLNYTYYKVSSPTKVLCEGSNPTFHRENLYSVFGCSNNSKGTIFEWDNFQEIAESATVLKFDGDSWDNLSVPIQSRYHDIKIVDEHTWIIVGDSTIITTTDKGSTWREHIDDNKYFAITSSEVTYWVCGSAGKIMYTHNLTKDWNISHTPVDKNLYGISFFNSSYGIAVGENIIIRTTNAGKSWSTDTENYNILSVYRDVLFVNNIVWTINSNFEIYNSKSFGEYWTIIIHDAEHTSPVHELYVVSGNVLYALWDTGHTPLIRWTRKFESPLYMPVIDIFFRDDPTDDVIYCSTPKGIHALYSYNGTEKWVYAIDIASHPGVDCGKEHPRGYTHMIYVGSNGELHAINPNGTIDWKLTLYHRFKPDDGNFTTPLVEGPKNEVYIGSTSGSLYAIKCDSKNLKWSSVVEIPITAPQLTINPRGDVFASANGYIQQEVNGKLVERRVGVLFGVGEVGNISWRYIIITNGTVYSPMVPGEFRERSIRPTRVQIYVGDSKGYLWAFDSFGEYLAPLPPTWVKPSKSGNTYWLGTDKEGRDILSQLVWGSRIALMVGISAAFFSVMIGLIIGLVSGYFGGTIDTILMRFTDVILVLPGLPVLVILAAIFGPNIWNLVWIIAIMGWPGMARVIRAEVLSLKARPYVDSARVTGATDSRIMFRHIAPNVLPLVALFMTFATTGTIVAEAALSFIGLGDPTTMSWGIMLQYVYMSGKVLEAWWWLWPPGLCITFVCLGFFLLGRAWEEIVNPRLRKRER